MNFSGWILQGGLAPTMAAPLDLWSFGLLYALAFLGYSKCKMQY
jgi:hypothetical protein